MADNDRHLPQPPRSRFGRQLRGDDEAAGPLTADRMAQAAAEGRLEEFLQREIPGGEHARNLAMMMMGMSGMMPISPMPGEPSPAAPRPACESEAPGATPAPEGIEGAASTVPPEVLAAIGQADVAGLAELLRAEHAKRCGMEPAAGPRAEEIPYGLQAPAPASPGPAGAPPARPGIDAAIVDELIRIAADNDVTVDWLTLRAIRLYVEDYRKTGRL